MAERNFEVFLQAFQKVQTSGEALVVATLIDVKGEAPNHPGARIIVGSSQIHFGTVGGGKLERKVIEEARRELGSPTPRPNFFFEWNLQKDLGMTCGGLVRVFFEVFKPEMKWKIAVFGAGHVSQALCRLLTTLDCDVLCVDPRPEWIEKLPEHPRLRRKVAAEMEPELMALSDDHSVVLITMGHATDAPLLIQALKAKNFRYLGVMGSDVKAKRLAADVKAAGLTDADLRRYHCPIGEPIGNNSPAEIAVSITAQLLRVRDEKAHSPHHRLHT
jgi:xanthine dehydrogenase accessory factor